MYTITHTHTQSLTLLFLFLMLFLMLLLLFFFSSSINGKWVWSLRSQTRKLKHNHTCTHDQTEALLLNFTTDQTVILAESKSCCFSDLRRVKRTCFIGHCTQTDSFTHCYGANSFPRMTFKVNLNFQTFKGAPVQKVRR